MKYLSDYTNDGQTALFNKTGAFFAFSQKQFSEKEQEGVKYLNLGGGLIVPKGNEDELLEGLETLQKSAISQDVKDNGAAKIIEREYFNHESQLTMNTSDARAAISGHIEQFPDLFTDELINETFKNCFSLAVKNDWL